MSDRDGALLIGGMLFFVLVFIVAVFVVYILYANSLYKALKLVPREKLEFPEWFAWMILIPLAGIVFTWLVIVINIPKSFARVVVGNSEAEASLKSLSNLGLALAILQTISWIPVLNYLTGIPTLVVWIIYWVKVVDFRKKYLETLKTEIQPQQGNLL